MREGECTPGCGSCCRFLRLQVNPQYIELPDVKHWIELHGIRLRKKDGGVWAYIPISCTALTPEGMCGLQGKPERPELCATFPEGQWQLDELTYMGVDNCTYTFTVPQEE